MTKSAIVLIVDRLGTGCLGPYGCTWVETPHFNALAARGLLMENVLVDSPKLPQAYRGYFAGRHVLESSSGYPNETIVRAIVEAGARGLLVTDDPQVAELPATEWMHEKLLVPSQPPTACAGDIEDTALAKLFAEALDALDRQQSPFLLWIHARGLGGPWDAPLALRQVLADEDDPDPITGVDVPSLKLPEDYDPDLLLGITQAYAAQVMAFDACLGILLDAVDRHPQQDDLLTLVTSPRGYPLGEHRVVGDCDDALHGELLHVPLFLWRGDGEGALVRSHALAQSPDVAATLADWFGVSSPSSGDFKFAQSLLPLTLADRVASPSANQVAFRRRDHVMSITDGQRAIRTPAWFLREAAGDKSLSSGEISRQLYRKPDDRWEVNEISRRCPQIVEQLAAAMDAHQEAIADNDSNAIEPLADELVIGID